MAEIETPEKSSAYVHAGETGIEANEILLELKFDPAGEFLTALSRRKVAVAIARKRNVSVDEDEIEAAQIEFYTERDLFEDEQIAQWLAMMHLEAHDVRAHVRELALIERAALELFDDAKVADRFAGELHSYERVTAEAFEFSTLGKAREFILAVRENELIPAGGAALEMMRRTAPEEIAAELFSAEAGDLFGPFEKDSGAFGVLILRERKDAVLDDDLVAEIREQMFDELVETELARSPIRFLK